MVPVEAPISLLDVAESLFQPPTSQDMADDLFMTHVFAEAMSYE
jgi:hypothetical protein